MANTKQKTLDLFQNLHVDSLSKLKSLEKFSEKTLNTPAKENTWSVMQVFLHLILVEETSLAYVKYKMDQGASFKKTGIREKFNVWVMKQAYNSPKKFKVPIESIIPSELDQDISQIEERWKSTRDNLLKLLQSLSEDQFEHNMYKHPMMGRINMHQMLTFFKLHQKRHFKQIDQILNQINKTV